MTKETEKELLAAVEEGIESVRPSQTTDPPVVEPDPPADPEPTVAASEDDLPVVPGPPKDPEVDPTVGDPLTEEPPVIASPATEEPPVEEPPTDPLVGAKPSDEFGELPEDANEKTRERFEKMRTSYDELYAENEGVKTRNDAWIDTVEKTGSNPEQFGMALNYLTLVNSGTVDGLQKAYDFMERELAVLGEQLGREAPGTDPLKAHPDLQERIDSGVIEREDALDIAQARATLNLNKTHQAQRATETEFEVRKSQALTDIAALGNKLRASDPNIASKMPYLQATIQAVVSSGSPPENWASSIEKAYTDMPTVEIPAPTIDPAPNPIRPTPGVSTSGNALDKEPGTMLEAVNDSLTGTY